MLCVAVDRPTCQGGSCVYDVYMTEVKGPLADSVTTPLLTTRDTVPQSNLLIEGPGT